jgi:transcriptional regulator with XRE-family HTH domain
MHVKHVYACPSVALTAPIARLTGMAPIPKPTRERRPSFLRQWRKHRGLTLETVGAEIGMDGTNLGRIEKGQVPYSQDLLEQLADMYGCEIADLLVRDPTDPEGMWSIWERAQPAQRNQIAAVAKALIGETSDPANTVSLPSKSAPKRARAARRSA